jgi:hypothetical protein
MPTFCRHNRFVERCPICSSELPGHAAGDGARGAASTRPAGGRRAARPGGAAAGRRPGRGHEAVRVRREGRAQDDGYRSELVAGLRASADADRLAGEIAFAAGRLQVLAARPPGLYGELRAGAADPEWAAWACFLTAYLCPLEEGEPFAGVRAALEALPSLGAGAAAGADEVLEAVPLGPRSSHAPGRGAQTLRAYAQWVERAGGGQPQAFAGDASWAPERRFERVFERLAIPGLTRTARYELLVLLGRLGLCEVRAESLRLAARRGSEPEDPVTASAKRVFGIGDPLLLERRAQALALELSVPIESLDLALWNWSASQRATLGFPPEAADEGAGGRARSALGLA